MTTKSAACPGCGATIVFRLSSAVQTVCPYCKSVLVRRDLDLEKVRTVSDLPPTTSPIQLGTEGKWGKDAFTVVGRIIYAYDRGGWNEWHLRTTSGTSRSISTEENAAWWSCMKRAACSVASLSVIEAPRPASSRA